MATAYPSIEALLTRHLGLDPASIGSRTISAAVSARMAAVGAPTEQAYLERLEHGDELAALVDAVVVPETWFLRDEVPFQYLASHARSAWSGRRPLRLLSAPCATGEEPYSLAISLLEAGFSPGDLCIDAVDVSEAALVRARAGHFGANSFRGDAMAVRDRWFEPRGEGFALHARVRSLVTFWHGNLLQAGCVPFGRRYDAVFCRNLFIYLTPDARAAVIARLDGLLAPGGLLVTGHAEGLSALAPRFRPVGPPGAFAFARADDAVTAILPGSAHASRAEPAPPAAGAHRGDPPGASPLLPSRQDTTTPRSASGEEAAGPSPRALLAEAASLADRGALDEAASLCERLVRTTPDAAAYALLGSIEQARDRFDPAERAFSRALYCDPAHYASLVQLALLRERRGDRHGAANLRRRASKARGGAS